MGRDRPAVSVTAGADLQVDKVTGRFNGQFKTYAICGAIRRMVSASLGGAESPRGPRAAAGLPGVRRGLGAGEGPLWPLEDPLPRRAVRGEAEVERAELGRRGGRGDSRPCFFQGESDDSILRLAKADGIVSK